MDISDYVCWVVKTWKQMSFKQTERSLLSRMRKEYCYVSTFQFLLDSFALCMDLSSVFQREDVMLGFLLIP
jgi:hypothetical protein